MAVNLHLYGNPIVLVVCIRVCVSCVAWHQPRVIRVHKKTVSGWLWCSLICRQSGSGGWRGARCATRAGARRRSGSCCGATWQSSSWARRRSTPSSDSASAGTRLRSSESATPTCLSHVAVKIILSTGRVDVRWLAEGCSGAQQQCEPVVFWLPRQACAVQQRGVLYGDGAEAHGPGR